MMHEIVQMTVSGTALLKQAAKASLRQQLHNPKPRKDGLGMCGIFITVMIYGSDKPRFL